MTVAKVAALRLGGVPEHVNLPWHLAMASDDLADLPLSWTDQPGGTGEMLSGLAAGTLDVVSILTEGTVAAVADGLAVTIMQVYVSSPLQWGVFVPARSGVVNEADLADRRIAISRPRSGSHLMAFVLAQKHRWQLTDDQFVVAGTLEGARAAFAAGEAEVFLWDQFMTRYLVDAGEFRQVGVLPTPWPPFVIAARSETLWGRTAEVGRVIDAVVTEALGLHGRPEAVDLLCRRYELSADSARNWLAATAFGPRKAWDPSLSSQILGQLVNAGFRPAA